MSDKQCRPRSDAAFCGIWSGSSLFAQAYLPKYIKSNDLIKLNPTPPPLRNHPGSASVRSYCACNRWRKGTFLFLLLLHCHPCFIFSICTPLLPVTPFLRKWCKMLTWVDLLLNHNTTQQNFSTKKLLMVLIRRSRWGTSDKICFLMEIRNTCMHTFWLKKKSENSFT